VRISIRSRLALATWFLAVAVIVASTAVAERHLRAGFDAERQRRVQEEAHRIDVALQRRHTELADTVARALSTHPAVLGALADPAATGPLEQLRVAVDVDILALVDLQGHIVSVSRDGLLVQDVASDMLFRDTVASGKGRQDMVQRGRSFEVRGVQPVYRGGQIAGMVMASHVLDQGFLDQIHAETDLHTAFTYEATILGTTLPAFHRVDSDAIFAVKAIAPDAPAAVLEEAFVNRPLTLEGDPYDAVFCPLFMGAGSDHLGTLVLLVSVDPLLQARARARTSMLITGAFSLVLATLVAAVMAFRLSRPIRRLAEAAHAMRAGDLSRRTGIRRRDEIGELALAFDEMAESLQQHVQQVRQLAVTDALTGLANRRRFTEELQREVARHQRFDSPMCLLFLDIDHFKRINDTRGHAEGDEVLKGIAAVMTATVRAVDLVCRHGGEEFAVVLPSTELGAAANVAERLRKAVAAQPMGRHGDIPVTVSVGVAAFPDDGTFAEELLKAADTRLYRAKETGRDRVVAEDG